MKLARRLTVMLTCAFLILSALLPGASVTDAQDNTRRVTVAYHFAAPVITPLGDGTSRITLDDLPRASEPGRAALPYRMARILLPPEGEVLGVTVQAEGEEVVATGIVPEVARAQLPTGAQDAHATDGSPHPDPLPGYRARESVARPAMLRSSSPLWEHRMRDDTARPALQERAGVRGNWAAQWLNGYRVLLVPLDPLRYDAAYGVLRYVPRLVVTVQLGPSGPARLATTTRADPLTRARVAGAVDNPADVARFGRALPERPQGVRRLHEAAWPGPPCDYLIVTSRKLADAFAPLVAQRGAQGLVVRTVAIEDILAAYDGTRPSGGVDDASRLRNFLVDAYATWEGTAHPLRYVLLGGNAAVIPVRTVYVRAGIYVTSDTDPLISDLYYAGLEGTWDQDGDGRYGEGAASAGGTGAAGEEADLTAEIYVGRVPVAENTEGAVDQEVRQWIAKELAYEENPTAPGVSQGVWLGEQLDTATYGDDSKELILNVARGLGVERLYDSIYHWSSGDLTARLEAGVGFVNHLGHANTGYVLRMSSGEVQALTNSQPFLVHSQGCLAARLPLNGQGHSIGETFVVAPHAAYAYIGNTSYGWYLPKSTQGASQLYDYAFFEALFQRGITNLGRALQEGKEQLLLRGQVGAVGPERWVYLELTLLGDPYTPVVTQYADPIARLASPARLARLASTVTLRGTAARGAATGAAFYDYQLLYGPGAAPQSWTALGASTSREVRDGVLGTWDVSALKDGTYTLRLRVTDGQGRTSHDDLVVQVDHAYFTAPEAGASLRAGDPITLTGTASSDDFGRYVIELGQGLAPSDWTPVITGTRPVISGTLGVWDSGVITQAGSYTLRLRLPGSARILEEDADASLALYLDPTYHAGWPRAVGNRLSNEGLAVGDLNGDGRAEVVATEGMKNCGGALEGGPCGSYGMRVYAWDAEGRLLPGFPLMPGSDNRLTAPALADFDGDGKLEIFFGSVDGSLYAYRFDGTPVEGFPRPVGATIEAAPACGDIDGDGHPEVVVCSTAGRVMAYSHAGRAWAADTLGAAATPLLADLNRDGKAEVVTASQLGQVSAFRGDGAILEGWPIDVTARFLAAPVAADLNQDGWLEVIAVSDQGAFVFPARGARGVALAGWPVMATLGSVGSSPAVADLDGDAQLEVIWASESGGIDVWRADGTPQPGWGGTNQPRAQGSSPVVGDIDGDGGLEIVLVGDDMSESLYAYHADGRVVAGFPRRIEWRATYNDWSRRSSAVLADLNGDGKIELGVGVEGKVYWWNLGGTAERIPWPTYHGNMARSGVTTVPGLLPYALRLPLILGAP